MQPEELTRIIGKNVCRRRTELGWTQTKLAEEIGVAPGYISDIEAGKRTPRVATLAQIAEALKVPPSHLVDAQAVTPI